MNETTTSTTWRSVRLSQNHIDTHLKNLASDGCTLATLQSYRRSLESLALFLPEDKIIRPGTLTAWRESLLESGYARNSVNLSVSAANGLMLHLGHRELQTDRLPEPKEDSQPELTREEYLRLLSTAKMLDKRRVYLLIKVFGSTGIGAGEAKQVTVEAVQHGKLSISSGLVRIPKGLREELLQFIRDEGIVTGQVFLTRNGKPPDRSTITRAMQTVCRDARVSMEKATPRCLKKLYQAAQAEIQRSLSGLAQQLYEQMLDQEHNLMC